MMSPFTALLAVLALLVVATLIGVLLQRRGGRVRNAKANRVERLDPESFGVSEFGNAGTVVQFSTEYCARCPGVRRTLTELVEQRGNLAFTHIDLTHRPELARRFNVLQTPTVLLIDGDGTLRSRLSGPVSRTTMTTALNELTGDTP